jgi:hypothetical protein
LGRLNRDLFGDRSLTMTALGPLKKGAIERVMS